MRLPKENEDLVGKICVCSTGRVAAVIGKMDFSFGNAWIGIGYDGKGTWASTNPCVVAETAIEFHDKLYARFGGKMSLLG